MLQLILLILLWLAVPVWAQELPPIPKPAMITLPDDLRAFLEYRYPKFRVAEKKDYCRGFEKTVPFVTSKDGEWAYGVLEADFNGDQLLDYTLIIKYKGKYLWLVALKNKNSNSPYEITEFGQPAFSADHDTQLNPPPAGVKGKICDGVLVIGEANQLTTQVETPEMERWLEEQRKNPQYNPYPYPVPAYEEKRISLNPFPYLGLETGSTAIQYYWKDGKWNKWGYEP